MRKNIFSIFAVLFFTLSASAQDLMTCIDTYFPGKVTYTIGRTPNGSFSLTLDSGEVHKVYLGPELSLGKVGNVIAYATNGAILSVNLSSGKAILLTTTVD